jgi:hypothetical protein
MANAVCPRSVVGRLTGVPIGQANGKFPPTGAPGIVGTVRPNLTLATCELNEGVIGPRRRRDSKCKRKRWNRKGQGCQSQHDQTLREKH